MGRFIVGQLAQARYGSRWHDAEILAMSEAGAYVYLVDSGERVNLTWREIRRDHKCRPRPPDYPRTTCLSDCQPVSM